MGVSPIVAIAEGARVSKGLSAERGSQGRELNSRLDPSPASAVYKPRRVEGTVEFEWEASHFTLPPSATQVSHHRNCLTASPKGARECSNYFPLFPNLSKNYGFQTRCGLTAHNS